MRQICSRLVFLTVLAAVLFCLPARTPAADKTAISPQDQAVQFKGKRVAHDLSPSRNLIGNRNATTEDGEAEQRLVSSLPPTSWDCVNTSCLSLIVSNHGNMGRDGYSGATMDYYPEDCDTVTGKIYLYDGSPLIGSIIGDDTVLNSCIWGVSYLSEDGLYPWGGPVDSKLCGGIKAEAVESGVFTAGGATIAIEKIWVAPIEECHFIIEYMRVWSYDGLAHENLMLGEVIDWDVPWDDIDLQVFHVNSGGFDNSRNLLYQQGYESPSDSDMCYIMNDERFAGASFVESYFNGQPRSTVPFGGFIGELLSFSVYPGLDPGRMYAKMAQPGLSTTQSVADLFSAFCFEKDIDLGASDVYEVVTVLATIKQGTLSDLGEAIDDGVAWYTFMGGMDIFADPDANDSIDICEPCCGLMGDFDHDRNLVIADIVGWINWAFHIPASPEPVCEMEADVDGDYEPTIADITYLIDYAFRFGPEPAACPGPLNPPPEP